MLDTRYILLTGLVIADHEPREFTDEAVEFLLSLIQIIGPEVVWVHVFQAEFDNSGEAAQYSLHAFLRYAKWMV